MPSLWLMMPSRQPDMKPILSASSALSSLKTKRKERDYYESIRAKQHIKKKKKKKKREREIIIIIIIMSTNHNHNRNHKVKDDNDYNTINTTKLDHQLSLSIPQRSQKSLIIEDRSLQEIYESVKELLLETCGEKWAKLTKEDISVEPLSGGITNKMFICEPPKPMKAVVCRVYGSSTDLFVSRTDESEMVVALNRSNFGAKVRAVFQGGWIEDFIPSSSLTPIDMKKREILRTVAGIIKRFHELEMPHRIARPKKMTTAASCNDTKNKDHDVEREQQKEEDNSADNNVAGEFWETVDVWYAMAQDVSFPEDPEKQKLLDALRVPDLKEKIKRVRKMCDATNSPTVFCHNDIHAGNFLVEEPSKKLILIDFEYSAHGPRGFDLANFFCEFAGFECDYSLLPDKETRETFYDVYITPEQASCSVEQLEKEVEVFYIATHLFWGIWSVLQSKFSPIEFDFLDYARMRLRQGAVLLGENVDALTISRSDSPLETPKSPHGPSSWGTVNDAHFSPSRRSENKNNVNPR